MLPQSRSTTGHGPIESSPQTDTLVVHVRENACRRVGSSVGMFDENTVKFFVSDGGDLMGYETGEKLEARC